MARHRQVSIPQGLVRSEQVKSLRSSSRIVKKRNFASPKKHSIAPQIFIKEHFTTNLQKFDLIVTKKREILI